jgi:hypothetical protein
VHHVALTPDIAAKLPAAVKAGGVGSIIDAPRN